MRVAVFPGWWVVFGTFFVLMVGFGAAYAFAAFFTPLTREFSATRAETSLVFSIAALLYFSLGLPSGWIADRVGPRWVVAIGMLVVAAGLALASRATALWQIYLGYGLGVGLGLGLAYVPSIAAVQRWFVRRRGLASGIAISGIGVGTLGGAPLCGFLMQSLSWRGAWLVVAGLAAMTCLVSLATIKSAPQDYDLAPDGDAATPSQTLTVAAGAGSSLAEALRSRPYWTFYLAMVLLSFGLFLPFVHLVPFARDNGLGEAYGVFLVTLLGIGSTIGRFALASLAGLVGRKRAWASMFGGSGAMLLLWASTTDPIVLAVFATLFGAFYGGFVATAPSLAADYFGPRALGAIIGALYTCVAIGSFIGPPAAGWAFDIFGSYRGAIVLGAVLSFVGMVLVLSCPDPLKWQRRQAARDFVLESKR